MNHPNVVSHADWLAARKQLLAREKEFTRQRDKLNAERRELPMVKVEKEYIFDGPEGPASLFDLFDGRRQLPSPPDLVPGIIAGDALRLRLRRGLGGLLAPVLPPNPRFAKAVKNLVARDGH